MHVRTCALAELEGKPVDEVVEAIKRDQPTFNVVVVPMNSPVTMDYRVDRVRVFVQDGVVPRAPMIG